ncbi:MAG: hypothetical protein GYB68_04235, partial [Chloroflexi bacterium]|nr:hypothetical protein [Chloroflexota bacterium]
WGLFALLTPTLWLLAVLLSPLRGDQPQPAYDLLTGVLSILTLINLPYLGYLVLLITQGETYRLPTRMLTGLIVIVLLVGGLGFGVGRYHYLFMTCDQFTVAGDFAPPNCLDLAEDQNSE